MKIRITVRADELAMMVKNSTQRDAWVQRYETEIRGIERNALRDAKERYEKNLKAGSVHDTKWARGMIRSLEKKIAHNRHMINTLMAMQF